MKALLNDPNNVVAEALEGAALTQPWLALLADRTIAVRRDRLVTEENRGTLPVALISGGGAGHEPAHAGYVAEGMLTAAVSGAVFASPSVDAVLDGIRAVTGDAGALLIVKSYTGDRLNFGLAAELARAEGLTVEMVVVADDVALADDDANAGRRGLAGTILVHKVAGALAEGGADLAAVADGARRVASLVGTYGVGLSPVTVPGGEPGFVLGDDEIELGLGIHGEPGVSREKVRPVDELAAYLIDAIVDDRGLADGARVALLAGNAGATPTMQMLVLVRAAVARLRERGLVPVRVWQGPVLTSIDMLGCSLSVLAVDDELLRLLDAPTAAPAWPGRGFGWGELGSPGEVVRVAVPAGEDSVGSGGAADGVARAAIDRVAAVLLAAEAELTELDAVVGDGDLGQALARGARAWQADPVEGSAAELLRELSARVRREVGGTSGPLYAAGLLRAAQELAEGADWPAAFRAGVAAITELGGAAVGDRTMVDALAPAADASSAGLDAAIAAARAGADATADQLARRGRSSYLGERVRGHRDPGAAAVALWLEAIRG